MTPEGWLPASTINLWTHWQSWTNANMAVWRRNRFCQSMWEILAVSPPLLRALCRIKLLPVTHVLVDTWMLTVQPVYKLLKGVWWPEMDYKHTCDTIFTHFQGITNNIYGFGRLFLLLHFFTRPPTFLPVHIRFYPSKWQVGGFLHKAMPLLEIAQHPVFRTFLKCSLLLGSSTQS